MKVLFAVNDENISASIVQKYQKQYKEIISYKNVYYFNAILKELQRNKSYDRIVISEDLEEFTSSSLEQKDKFIFDRLDNISDEAVNSNGTDIPIILICSERRNKSEEILIKLFGISVYNAIIGDDRSIDEVCRLINKPRSKKEAKTYYRIDSESVSYEKESESDVNEIEMQNILMHFKKLGKNEDKYAESFKNIVSQYNDTQLKVIISILPKNVKNILEVKSPEYQKIMGIDVTSFEVQKETPKNEIKKVKKEKNKQIKGISERKLGIDSKPVMSKPIVVPTTLENNIYKKVSDKNSNSIEDIDLLDDDDIFDDVQEIEEPKPKKRGRPRKNPIVEKETNNTEDKPKRRGRPRKHPVVENDEEEDINILPGFEDDDNDNILPGLDMDEENEENVLPNIDETYEVVDSDEDIIDDSEDDVYQANEIDDDDDDDDDDIEDVSYNNSNQHYAHNDYESNSRELEKYDNVFDDEFESLLSGDKKIATFVGTSKNGTSFIVNNIAQILSGMGINTAILDATKNRNDYYIYTNDDENLRNKAVNSFKNLINGKADGIRVNDNLTIYTGIPSEYDEINNSHPILENIVKNHSMVLIDCDFDTPVEYFEKSQEIYLIQSMDVLTIQALTEFLRKLKIKKVLDENKIRIILNKLLRVKGINGTSIIGGMSNYNDPEMSFMTELFDRSIVRVAAQIPFDEDVYAKYLENIVKCTMRTNVYPKEFKQKLNELAGVIYPLLPNKNDSKNRRENKKGYNQYTSSFSSGMNNTLENMRKKY